MRRIALIVAMALLCAPSVWADGFKSATFFATGSDTGIPNINTGIGFHKITWNVSGTVSTCSVQLDSSADGVTWTAAGAIASQTCTANGSSAVTAGTFNNVRMTVTTLTGGGSVSVTWNGYVNNPTSGGGTPGGSNTQAQYNNAGAFAGSPALTIGSASPVTGVQTANALDVFFVKRNTDTSPTGNFLHFQTAGATDLFVLDITGTITAGIVPYARLATFPAACAANNFATQIAATPGCTQPSFANLSGTIAAAQLGSAHNVEVPLTCSDTSASGTAQVCNTSPTFTPVAGDCIIYTTTTANTGAGLTLNVNSLGAKSVAKWQGTTTLAANDVLAGKETLTCYDGTNWELHSIGNAPGGLANPMTTLGDIIFENSTPQAARLAGPTTPNSVAEILTSTPSGGVAQAPAWALPGVSGRTITATDTMIATDRSTWLLFNGASAFTETLPQANSAGFTSNFSFCFINIGAGVVTLTPTTSTIDGQASISIQKGQNGCITSLDNTNYTSRLAGNSQQVSAATNFGTALAAQTVMSLVSVTGNVAMNSSVQQSLAGVGCSAVSNTMSITWSYTAPGGTTKTTSGDSLNITGNGALDSVSNGSSVQISAKQGTAITYTTASTLASTGCTTTPQYTVYTKVVQ